MGQSPFCASAYAIEGIGNIADALRLPAPGVMVNLSPEFNPPMLKGLKVYPNQPFRFDFILDRGDLNVGNGRDRSLREESTKLIKYFLASLTVPEEDLWVNLSPYEKNRIVPQSFGQTEMGRDLLAEDYMLKQITASLIYPEGETGKKFWKQVYDRAQKQYGTTNVPVNTFNKVWIVPEKAVVYENPKAGTAYVVEAKLKVMLEQDYLSMSKHDVGAGSKPAQIRDGLEPSPTNQLGSQIIRQIVIPELTREVNEDKNFSQLRQVYNSLILAAWYKKKIKDSILEQVYANQNKVKGVGYTDSVILNKINSTRDSSSPRADQNDVDKIYQQYLKAFKKGVFNYIKEETDPLTQERIPRKYFSGGTSFAMLNAAMKETQTMDAAQLNDTKGLFTVSGHFNTVVGQIKSLIMTGSFERIVEGLERFQYQGFLLKAIGFEPGDTQAQFDVFFDGKRVGYLYMDWNSFLKQLSLHKLDLLDENHRGQGFFRALLMQLNESFTPRTKIRLYQVVNDRTLVSWFEQIMEQKNGGSRFYQQASGLEAISINQAIQYWREISSQRSYFDLYSHLLTEMTNFFREYMQWCSKNPKDNLRPLNSIAANNGFGKSLLDVGFENLNVEISSWGDIILDAVKIEDHAMKSLDPLEIAGEFLREPQNFMDERFAHPDTTPNPDILYDKRLELSRKDQDFLRKLQGAIVVDKGSTKYQLWYDRYESLVEKRRPYLHGAPADVFHIREIDSSGKQVPDRGDLGWILISPTKGNVYVQKDGVVHITINRIYFRGENLYPSIMVGFMKHLQIPTELTHSFKLTKEMMDIFKKMRVDPNKWSEMGQEDLIKAGFKFVRKEVSQDSVGNTFVKFIYASDKAMANLIKSKPAHHDNNSPVFVFAGKFVFQYMGTRNAQGKLEVKPLDLLGPFEKRRLVYETQLSGKNITIEFTVSLKTFKGDLGLAFELLRDDTSGLPQDQKPDREAWESFFNKLRDYFLVGGYYSVTIDQNKALAESYSGKEIFSVDRSMEKGVIYSKNTPDISLPDYRDDFAMSARLDEQGKRFWNSLGKVINVQDNQGRPYVYILTSSSSLPNRKDYQLFRSKSAAHDPLGILDLTIQDRIPGVVGRSVLTISYVRMYNNTQPQGIYSNFLKQVPPSMPILTQNIINRPTLGSLLNQILNLPIKDQQVEQVFQRMRIVQAALSKDKEEFLYRKNIIVWFLGFYKEFQIHHPQWPTLEYLMADLPMYRAAQKAGYVYQHVYISPDEEGNFQLNLLSEKNLPHNMAMNANKGGIDLTAAKTLLEIQNAGAAIKFHLDPAQLIQLQNAPGFVPVIINIQPLRSLRTFLGINTSVGVDKSA